MTELKDMTRKEFKEWVSQNASWCQKEVSSACDNCPHWSVCPIAKDYLEIDRIHRLGTEY